ncbi:MAG: mechanosensitive ion channel family protein [Candidatus Micrarchaeota archaeon]
MAFESFSAYLDWEAFGNTGHEYALALLAFAAAMVAVWAFKKIILASLRGIAKRTKNRFDDYVIDFIGEIKTPFYVVVSLYFSANFLLLPAVISKGLDYAMAFAIMYYAVKGVNRVISHFKDSLVAKRKREGEEDSALLDTMEAIVHFVVWAVAALVVLDNLGFDIGALLAGLGIGGIAIAIASQAVIADILAAFSIYFDKPFKVGDFIIVGPDMGTVKSIGIKTTRIQTLQGQELVVSNQELTSTRINNYKRMEKRRILFGFGVVYGTPVAKLKKIPAVVKGIIDAVPKCKADRVHFKKFGDFSLDFEAVYYLDTPDYNLYMDVQQEINLKIASAFEKDGIEFAFPTQTVYVRK